MEATYRVDANRTVNVNQDRGFVNNSEPRSQVAMESERQAQSPIHNVENALSQVNVFKGTPLSSSLRPSQGL